MQPVHIHDTHAKHPYTQKELKFKFTYSKSEAAPRVFISIKTPGSTAVGAMWKDFLLQFSNLHDSQVTTGPCQQGTWRPFLRAVDWGPGCTIDIQQAFRRQEAVACKSVVPIYIIGHNHKRLSRPVPMPLPNGWDGDEHKGIPGPLAASLRVDAGYHTQVYSVHWGLNLELSWVGTRWQWKDIHFLRQIWAAACLTVPTSQTMVTS